MREKTTIAKAICTVCGSSDVSVFLEMPSVPVYANVLCSTYNKAVNIPRRDIHLAFCQNCSHIFNSSFQPPAIQYEQGYENPLNFSTTFQIYATTLAKRLIATYDLHNKDIIEIGCGNGDFLKLLCRLGNNRGIGFDPAFNGDDADEKTNSQAIFIRDYYSPAYASCKADFICCRHVLEHIQFPQQFLSQMRDCLPEQSETRVFFEVPDCRYTFRKLGIWDLIYEHCSYFSAESLTSLFASCRFDVHRCIETYAGQFLNIDAVPTGDGPTLDIETDEENTDLSRYVETFSDRYHEMIDSWREKMDDIGQSYRRVVIWGAGSKAVTFLNLLQIDSQVEYVVDINPGKQGNHIPGTGHEIIAPEFLKEVQPDLVIIMNPIYTDEIRSLVAKLHLKSDFMSHSISSASLDSQGRTTLQESMNEL